MSRSRDSERMIQNHNVVASHGQSKGSVENEYLKNYQEIVENVDIT
jgi:hypothetical protein